MGSLKETYKGHRIELREADGQAAGVGGAASEGELLIDGAKVPYGKLPEGQYYLRDYAYDWHDKLVDVARKYVDYIEKGDNK